MARCAASSQPAAFTALARLSVDFPIVVQDLHECVYNGRRSLVYPTWKVWRYVNADVGPRTKEMTQMPSPIGTGYKPSFRVIFGYLNSTLLSNIGDCYHSLCQMACMIIASNMTFKICNREQSCSPTSSEATEYRESELQNASTYQGGKADWELNR
jgi:hypothetical protein